MKRTGLGCFAALMIVLIALPAGAEDLPQVVQDQMAVIERSLIKAKKEYQKKIREENARLVAGIRRAIVRADKAKDAEQVAALQVALARAESFELLRPWLEPDVDDLLDLKPPVGGAVAAIAVSTNEPVDTLAGNKPMYSNRDYLISGLSEELRGLSYLRRPFKSPSPCVVKVLKDGILYLGVGDPPDGLDYKAMGFAQTELFIDSAAGRHGIVARQVKAGEVISLPPSAKTNTFPIFKPR